jgi:hypothetical protein
VAWGDAGDIVAAATTGAGVARGGGARGRTRVDVGCACANGAAGSDAGTEGASDAALTRRDTGRAGAEEPEGSATEVRWRAA